MTLISAFPGTGKSFLCDNKKYVLDIDSSYIDKNKFPQNYIDCIKKNINSCDIMCISTHESVRKLLYQNGIEFTLIYPSISLKYEYIQRYRDRNNPERFVKLLHDNWEKFITEMIECEYSTKQIILKSGEFISDVL